MERGLTEMNFPEFNSLLINGMIEKWIIFLIVLVVAVACDMWYIHERNCTKKENEEMRLSVNFLMAKAAKIIVKTVKNTFSFTFGISIETLFSRHHSRYASGR